MSKEKIILPLDISVIISTKNNLPIIELRRKTSDDELIKKIVYSAINELPLDILPIFINRLQAINSLIDKSINYYDGDKGLYYFTK
jgi:hypothetical protein